MIKNRRMRGMGRTLLPAHTGMYPKFRLKTLKSNYLEVKHGQQRKNYKFDVALTVHRR
jgi:hypothetical protein